MDMNIIVTGAAGGIGSTISYYLHKLGHNIFMLDNLRNGYEKNLTVDGKTFGQFILNDIRNINTISELKNKKFDALIHMAAITSLPDCETHVEETISINVEGTASVLEFSRHQNIPYTFYASTSAVYENNTEEIFSENLQVNPKLWYSLSKKMGEDVCDSYRKNYGLTITTGRFFNVFGPKQDIYRKNPPLINYVVNMLSNNKIPVLHSDGSQRRDYIHVNDVVNFVELCLQKKPNLTLNVCSEQTLSVREIIECIQEEIKSEITPIYRDAQMLWDTYPSLFEGYYPLKKEVVIKETNKKSIGSNKLAKDILGWDPNKNLKNLIKQTCNEMLR